MFKAILCDDDEVIAEGLGRFIPWKELGIELCGCCNNGVAAKELLDQENPDILISDVRMPFMDGLELTRYAMEVNPNIKVIIISGYDDFKYAQEAIRLGAMDYILKPVDEEDLTGRLKKAVEDCRLSELQKKMASDNEQQQKKEQMQYLIFAGPNAFEKRYGREALEQISNCAGMVMAVCIDHFDRADDCLSEEEQQELVREMFRSIELQSRLFTVFEKKKGEAVGYITSKNMGGVAWLRDETVRRVRSMFTSACPGWNLTFAMSSVQPQIRDIRKLYDEVMLAVRERFVYPAGSDIYYEKIKSDKKLSKEEFDNLLAFSELSALITQGDRNKVCHEIDNIEKRLLQTGGKSYLFVSAMTGKLFMELFQNLRQYGIEEDEMDVMSEYQKISKCQSVETIMEGLKDLTMKIMGLLEQNRKNSSMKMISAARAYIDEHYMDHALSMDDTAKYVHMSPSYFSVIFKRETGLSFTDYLIRYRIRKSQELMRNTDLKIYEISDRVGYDTAAYYSTAFKKETGYSPSEYKKIFIDQSKA